MRQAGRYLPEYRRVRERFGFLELCKNSEAAAEVTVASARRIGADAAIVFADILLPLVPMGVGLHFEAGEGPCIERPVRDAAAVAALQPVNVRDALAFVGESVRLSRAELGNTLPVIGFAGAPFTVGSYAIEGGSSRTFVTTKTFMYAQPAAWDDLMSRIATVTIEYLQMQVDNGAAAVQLFDSWVGCLSPADYERYALPYVQRIVDAIRPAVPVIYFGTMTSGLLPQLRATGADVVGLDWRVDLKDAWDALGDDIAVQGNLDPVRLLGDAQGVRDAAREILRRANGRPGHIFNLGHGVLPNTPVDNVLALIDAVHEYRHG
jgi:uroporphyrinogen decarboxylase